MKGHPLVLAIADFHDDRAMLWSSTAPAELFVRCAIRVAP